MPGHSPRVTVAIATFNRAELVVQAITSILAQAFGDFELLVVDDGSTDRTAEALCGFKDKRLRVVRHDTNQGIPATRNHALALARGAYLAYLDSDDWALPSRLGLQVAWLDAHPQVAALGGAMQWCEGAALQSRVIREPVAPEHIRAMLVFRCCLRNRTLMARTEVLRRLGYDEAMTVAEDYHLLVRLSQEHQLANLPDVLVWAGRHEGQITRRAATLNMSKTMEAQALALDLLGMPHDAHSLARHHRLWGKAEPFPVPASQEDLAWTRGWLEALQARFDARGWHAGGRWAIQRTWRKALHAAGLPSWRRWLLQRVF